MRLILTLILVLAGFAAQKAEAGPGAPPPFWQREWPKTDLPPQA